MSADVFVELAADDSGDARIGRMRKGVLEEIPVHAFHASPGMKAVAFAPALLMNRLRIPVPARSETEAHRSALYTIEDDLAQPIEEITLVLGPRQAGTSDRDAFVVDTALLQSWRARLEQIGLGQAVIVAESSLRSRTPAVWDFGDRVLLTRLEDSFVADKQLGDDTVRGFIAASGFSDAPVRKAGSLATLAELHLESPGVEISSGKSAQMKGLRAWQTTAALAMAGLLIWTITLYLDTRAQESAAQRADQTARQMFRTQFAGVPEPADVHAEVRRIMQDSAPGSAADFQPMASALFKAISGSDTIQLSRLSYAAAEQSLQAELRFANTADEAAFRSRLVPAGLQVESAEVTDLPGDVQGRFVLRSVP
ncbi:type II secretion system protein GspL [Hyphomonas sp.]|uniref:type II secretion system protein GspL n=1 Tax=Hyphomonas sp. TaxID=87 RepID=UPI00391C8191